MTYLGVECKKEWMYVYVQLTDFAIQQKITQHCKSNIFQKKIIKNFKNGFKNILDTPEKRISELKKRSVESVQNKVQRRKKYFKNF